MVDNLAIFTKGTDDISSYGEQSDLSEFQASSVKDMRMSDDEFDLRYDILLLRINGKIDSSFDTEKEMPSLLDDNQKLLFMLAGKE